MSQTKTLLTPSRRILAQASASREDIGLQGVAAPRRSPLPTATPGGRLGVAAVLWQSLPGRPAPRGRRPSRPPTDCPRPGGLAGCATRGRRGLPDPGREASPARALWTRCADAPASLSRLVGGWLACRGNGTQIIKRKQLLHKRLQLWRRSHHQIPSRTHVAKPNR